jgi:hypothetical protein
MELETPIPRFLLKLEETLSLATQSRQKAEALEGIFMHHLTRPLRENPADLVVGQSEM